MNETRTNETVRLSKRLKANGRYFAFDSNANQLLPLDRPAHDLLPHFKRSGYASKRFNKRFSREAFSTGLENLENLWDRGFFRDRNNIELPFSNEYFKDKVGKKIQSFTLSLTENCNLRCKYCLFSGKSKGYREHSRKTMTLDTARKAVDFILKSTADIIEIGFYGGEPLLKLGLIKKIIDYVDLKNDDNRQVRFRMTTNGTLLTKSIADYLVRNDVLLSVSLDGPRKTHDRNRVFTNEAGSFEIVMKHLKYIKDTYPAYFSTITIIAVVVPPYDYKTLEDFFSQDSELFEQNKIILTDLEVERNDFFDEPEQRFVTKDKFVQKRNRYKKSLLSKLENPDCSLNLFQKTFISWYYSSFSSLFSKDKAKAPSFPDIVNPGAQSCISIPTGNIIFVKISPLPSLWEMWRMESPAINAMRFRTGTWRLWARNASIVGRLNFATYA